MGCSTDSIYCLRNDNETSGRGNFAAASESHYADNAPSERSKEKRGEMSQNPQKSYVYSDVNGAGVVRRKVAIIGAGPVSFVLLSPTKK